MLLLRGARFLVARVHKGAAAALRAEVGIADGRAALFCAEATDQLRVGLEFGRPAVELARVAKDHAGTAVHGLDEAADAHIHVFVLAEFAHFAVVFPETDDGETAVVVRGLRGANVEEASSVGKLNHVINMSVNANVLI